MISLLLLAWFLKTTFLLSLSFGEPESKVLTLSAAFLAMANCFLIDGFSSREDNVCGHDRSPLLIDYRNSDETLGPWPALLTK